MWIRNYAVKNQSTDQAVETNVSSAVSDTWWKSAFTNKIAIVRLHINETIQKQVLVPN